MKNYVLITLLIITLIPLSTGCRKNSLKVNVSGIDATVEIKRLEKDLFEISPGNLADSVEYLKLKYGSFMKYFGYVISLGEISDTLWNENLLNFCTDKLNNEVYNSTISVFPDVSELERGLSDAFKHYRYYFPHSRIPEVYTFISGFNRSIITGDTTLGIGLGIGLDRYLGSSSKYYQQLMLFRYQTAKMNPENIIPDCIYGYSVALWDYESMGYEQDNILSAMIHEGKLLYFTKCMLPDVSDELIFGFSNSQLKFCYENEGRMWQYLIENNLIFKTDQLTRKKLTGEAAFTSYFSTDSPGRAAVWTGYRIVESYMAKNRNISLRDLMKETDIQSILEKARYRPPAG